jgi:Leucine-rich repeat (LRR) protein
LKSIFDLLENSETSSHNVLKNDLTTWISNFANKIGIVPEEAKFFLDVEALFAITMKNYEIDLPTYKYYKSLTCFSKSESWLVIKNRHVEDLSFNLDNWRFLKENQHFFKSISRLSYPSLYLNTIKKYNFSEMESLQVPNSIGLLTHLKVLDLSRNMIIEIPKSICSLPSLEELDLSRNEIREIPESLSLLQSLRILNLARNHIQVIPLTLLKYVNSLEKFNY